MSEQRYPVLDTHVDLKSEQYQQNYEANVGSLLVEMNGKIVGIVTERDILRRVIAGDKDADTTTVAEIMSSPVKTCNASDEVSSCFDILREHDFRHLAVMDGEEPLGVISLRDVALELR